ncbi:tetratricopeptide repeat protein [Paenibacillus hubeiensis]|uniref:tetratricopeptide repeat protein n=1 Tax=Paenibacillus hubeiensis TaxID=3077330 RepID=UPI0031B9ADBB
MNFPSYFGPKLSGGSYSSAGYLYQDICALFGLFNSLNRGEKVTSLGIEMTNDFTIHRTNSTITAQVKKTSMNINDILGIIRETPNIETDTIMIVCTNFQEDLRQLITKIERYKHAMNSDLDETWKISITRDFYEELNKRGINDLQDCLFRCEFLELPENMAYMALYFVALKWLENYKATVDLSNFMNTLMVHIQFSRANRGSLSISELEMFVKNHSTESIVNHIIKSAYESQFIEPSQIISMLGETKEEILDELETNIQLAQKHLDNGEFKESLEIYLALDKLYKKEVIKFNCSVLFELLDDYKRALDYSSEVLKLNPSHYDANLIKGSCLGRLNRIDEAIEQFEKTLSIKESEIAHYSLGYTYLISKRDNSMEKAIRHFKACIELDQDFVSAHLNLSIAYFQSGVYMESLVHINKTLQLDPELSNAYSHKGELYRFFGLYDDAIDYFEECLSRNAQNKTALYGISLTFAEKGYLSESAIYFKQLFQYYRDDFFKLEFSESIGRMSQIIDIGWKRTLLATLEVLDVDHLAVHICGVYLKIPLNETKDFIFIGTFPLSDYTGTILYPMVGKFIEKLEDFHSIKKQIQNSVDIFQYFDKPLYVNFDKDIEIQIQEREKYILIEIFFSNVYKMVGITDQKSGSLEAFIDYFEEYGQCRIHLECTENSEKFIIDGIKNVQIDTLKR